MSLQSQQKHDDVTLYRHCLVALGFIVNIQDSRSRMDAADSAAAPPDGGCHMPPFADTEQCITSTGRFSRTALYFIPIWLTSAVKPRERERRPCRHDRCCGQSTRSSAMPATHATPLHYNPVFGASGHAIERSRSLEWHMTCCTITSKSIEAPAQNEVKSMFSHQPLRE